MICTHCINPNFRSDSWKEMRGHYKEWHPEVQRPDKFFTKEARAK